MDAEDPRYGRYKELRELQMPHPAGTSTRVATGADAIEEVLSATDGKPHAEAGPKAQRAKKALDAGTPLPANCSLPTRAFLYDF